MVWGLIIIRIFNYSDKSTDYQPHSQSKKLKEDKLYMPDTFLIKADYRDPFLATLRRTTPVTVQNQATQVNRTQQQPVIRRDNRNTRFNRRRVRWPNIEFGGVIQNENSKEITALVKINDQNRLLFSGDIVEDITVVAIYNDSIIVSYQDEQETIIKTESN
jgi:hypothetical protein